jgi:hypothetical protein
MQPLIASPARPSPLLRLSPNRRRAPRGIRGYQEGQASPSIPFLVLISDSICLPFCVGSDSICCCWHCRLSVKKGKAEKDPNKLNVHGEGAMRGRARRRRFTGSRLLFSFLRLPDLLPSPAAHVVSSSRRSPVKIIIRYNPCLLRIYLLACCTWSSTT